MTMPSLGRGPHLRDLRFPCAGSARGVYEGTVFLSETSAGETVDGRVDFLHVLGSNTGGTPELAGLVGIDFADHQPVGLLQCVDILVRIRTDHHAIHAEGEDSLN